MKKEKISQLKTELSKLSGVNFHSPEYREVFKRLLVDDEEENLETKTISEEDKGNTEADNVATQEAKADDAVADEAVTTKAEEVVEDIKEDQAAESVGDEPDYQKTNEDEEELNEAVEEDLETDSEVMRATGESENSDNAESPEPPSEEEKALIELLGEDKPEDKSEVEEEAEVKTEAESQPAVNMSDELIESRLENVLLRAGIREDRMEVAKRLFLPELKAGKSIDEVREMVSQYPEWIGKKGGSQGFGMPVGGSTGTLTAEEKELKRMGIDPRN